MKYHRALLPIAVLVAAVSGVAVFWPGKGYLSNGPTSGDAHAADTVIPVPETPKDRLERVEIPEKATFGELMKSVGVDVTTANEIYAAAKDVYDLAKIHAGKTILLAYDSKTQVESTQNDPSATDEEQHPENRFPKELIYQMNGEEELHVRKTEGNADVNPWVATLEKIQYEIRQKTVTGTVNSSLYQAGLDQNLDVRAIIALANVFEWTIDFAQDVRVGDSFKFVYEELYRDGEYVMPGSVLVGQYVNEGTTHKAYAFTNSKGEQSYYDENGGSLKKMFLKAPLSFKYITSGFTTGMRYVSAFNTSTGHRAIDYAASKGTPIRATADGKVVMAGWDGPYGNKVSIRHNGTYTTNYAHQSKIAVKVGQQVQQGQIIGYVGSTGFSTGPHLHYEMVKNGVKINPLRETFPSSGPVPESEKAAFAETVATWVNF